MKQRQRQVKGFTIIEVLVIVVILGVIAMIITPRILGRIGQAKTSAAASTAASLANAVRMFSIDHGMPERGSTIDILWEKPGSVADEGWEPYVDKPDDLLDPWGRPFVLKVPGERNIDFDIVSYGSDGQPGGEGDAADIIKP
ncbi:MAG: type II secretion system major pseudopilin GspG [Planctomycetes bacterium]|nr:type II secretion system major pseudopilin GspG [Planctomycetota bacterium]MCH9057277.1 type II secretion system major pseudopilin GspG [Planctomycetota bacterium]